jgi:Lon protease-like protein
MEELMLFPLNTVLLPAATLSLHIFEPRYRTMVRVCLREKRAFGAVLIRAGTEVGGPATPHDIGVEATILAWQELDEGRYNIVVQGGRRFAILDLDHSHQYLVGKVRRVDDEEGTAVLTHGERSALIDSAVEMCRASGFPGRAADPEAWAELGDAELSFAVADSVPAPPASKQRLLAMTSPRERVEEVMSWTRATEAPEPRPSAP